MRVALTVTVKTFDDVPNVALMPVEDGVADNDTVDASPPDGTIVTVDVVEEPAVIVKDGFDDTNVKSGPVMFTFTSM